VLHLKVEPAQGESFDHSLEGEELVVGRSSECDLSISDRFMSRRHARLFKKVDGWWLEDLGSRNGSMVNGQMAKEPVRVFVGDRIVLSGSSLYLRDQTESTGIRASSYPTGDHTIFRQASEVLQSQVSIPPSAGAGTDLASYAARLHTLNEVHQALARSISLDELFESILGRVFALLEPEEGVIVLRQPDGTYRRAARRAAPGYEEEHLLSETLVKEVVEKGLAALVLDVKQDERFAGAESIVASGVLSLIAAPLADADGALGMIALNSRLHRHQFTEADMEMLTSIAAAAALRVRNLALAEEAAERRRLAHEVELARHIQVSLLPAQLPELDGYEMYGGTVPSQGVSGDFYEIVARDHECVLLVADVSGKGIGASLLTASLEALLVGPLEAGLPPDEICNRVSARLFARTPAAKYATAVLAVLDPESGHLTYTNAGHNPGLVVRSTGTELLRPCGVPIGLVEGARYSKEEIDLGPGDVLVLYSDGITEAENPEEEEFGLARLTAVCEELRSATLEDLASGLATALDEFASGIPFADDRTLVLLRRATA
jgi:serine phosphatase RsbU (regulator of sigma subunit)